MIAYRNDEELMMGSAVERGTASPEMKMLEKTPWSRTYEPDCFANDRDL